MLRHVALAAAGAAIALGLVACDRGATGTFRFETAKVDRGPIVAKVTASGTASALVTVQVGSQVSGRIHELLVDFNSPVTRGQVLARIDPQLFEAAVRQARANLDAARANLAKAKVAATDADRQLERNRLLFEQKLIAQATLDSAQVAADTAHASVGGAAAAVEQAAATLNEAEVNLGYTTIRSPVDGIVISRNVDVGQTVAASLQAPTLFTIGEDLAQMQIDTSVAEADVGKLRTGMTATFTVDAWPGERFEGTVRQIRNAPQTVQNVVTYDAVLDVQNGDLKLKPGMTASVTFVYAQRSDVLRVPNAALRFVPPRQLMPPEMRRTPTKIAAIAVAAAAAEPAPEPVASPSPGPAARPKGQVLVWKLESETLHPVSIVTGITDGTLTEVVSGDLRVGELLVTEAVPSSGASNSGFRRGPF